MRGASMQTIRQRPALIDHGDSVLVEVAGRYREFDAAVDATGRAASWSRPIICTHQMIAEVFEDLPTQEPDGLKLVRFNAGWAYRIGLRNYATVAILSRHRRSEFPGESSRRLSTSRGLSNAEKSSACVTAARFVGSAASICSGYAN